MWSTYFSPGRACGGGWPVSGLEDANAAAEVLDKQLRHFGLDAHAFGGLTIWSTRPLEGEPYVFIQGAMTPKAARLIADALAAYVPPADDLDPPALRV